MEKKVKESSVRKVRVPMDTAPIIIITRNVNNCELNPNETGINTHIIWRVKKKCDTPKRIMRRDNVLSGVLILRNYWFWFSYDVGTSVAWKLVNQQKILVPPNEWISPFGKKNFLQYNFYSYISEYCYHRWVLLLRWTKYVRQD